MSGLVLLALWCLVGGAVGGLMGNHSGRLGVGVLLGLFCGVFGWVLLAGAAPRQRATAASQIPEPVAARSTDAGTRLLRLSWMSRRDDQSAIATGGQS